MYINEVINVLENEKECVKRNIAGCDRDCINCDLVMLDETILKAYDTAINILNTYGGD